MKLIIDEHLKKERWNEKDKISGIYIITNLVNNKVYVGQTSNIRKRFSDYNGTKYLTSDRPVYKAIKKYGQDNFTFEIAKLVSTKYELDKYEKIFIQKYNSSNPKYGYNIGKGGGGATPEGKKKLSEAHIGLKESADTKRKKSNQIIMINLEDKIVIISDSGKLAGDYFDKSKDYIKNCLRQPSSIKGFRLFYDDYEKRTKILDKMYSKRSIRDKEYVKIGEYLNKLEMSGESVETIYEKIVKKYGKIYKLSYDNDSVSLEEFHLPYILEERDEDIYNVYEDYVKSENL